MIKQGSGILQFSQKRFCFKPKAHSLYILIFLFLFFPLLTCTQQIHLRNVYWFHTMCQSSGCQTGSYFPASSVLVSGDRETIKQIIVLDHKIIRAMKINEVTWERGILIGWSGRGLFDEVSQVTSAAHVNIVLKEVNNCKGPEPRTSSTCPRNEMNIND